MSHCPLGWSQIRRGHTPLPLAHSEPSTLYATLLNSMEEEASVMMHHHLIMRGVSGATSLSPHGGCLVQGAFQWMLLWNGGYVEPSWPQSRRDQTPFPLMYQPFPFSITVCTKSLPLSRLTALFHLMIPHHASVTEENWEKLMIASSVVGALRHSEDKNNNARRSIN